MDEASQMECIKKILDDPNYEEPLNEMADDVLVSHVKPLIAEASKHEIWEVYLEQRLDLSSFIPAAFGTPDLVALYGKTLAVMDHRVWGNEC